MPCNCNVSVICLYNCESNYDVSVICVCIIVMLKVSCAARISSRDRWILHLFFASQSVITNLIWISGERTKSRLESSTDFASNEWESWGENVITAKFDQTLILLVNTHYVSSLLNMRLHVHAEDNVCYTHTKFCIRSHLKLRHVLIKL
jgi:hypothetical protein